MKVEKGDKGKEVTKVGLFMLSGGVNNQITGTFVLEGSKGGKGRCEQKGYPSQDR